MLPDVVCLKRPPCQMLLLSAHPIGVNKGTSITLSKPKQTLAVSEAWCGGRADYTQIYWTRYFPDCFSASGQIWSWCLLFCKTNQAHAAAAAAATAAAASPPPPPCWLQCVALLPACNVCNVGLNPALWRAASFPAGSVRPWDFVCECFFLQVAFSLTVSLFPPHFSESSYVLFIANQELLRHYALRMKLPHIEVFL